MNRSDTIKRCITTGLREGSAERKVYGVSSPCKVYVNGDDTMDMTYGYYKFHLDLNTKKVTYTELNGMGYMSYIAKYDLCSEIKFLVKAYLGVDIQIMKRTHSSYYNPDNGVPYEVFTDSENKTIDYQSFYNELDPDSKDKLKEHYDLFNTSYEYTLKRMVTKPEDTLNGLVGQIKWKTDKVANYRTKLKSALSGGLKKKTKNHGTVTILAEEVIGNCKYDTYTKLLIITRDNKTTTETCWYRNSGQFPQINYVTSLEKAEDKWSKDRLRDVLKDNLQFLDRYLLKNKEVLLEVVEFKDFIERRIIEES